MGAGPVAYQDWQVVSSCGSASTHDPSMPNKTAFALPSFAAVTSRAPTHGVEPGVRVFRPLLRVLARPDVQLERPPGNMPDCEVRHFAPGTLICATPAPRHECFDALAAWLAMPLPAATAATTLLQAQGLLTLRDGVLRAIGLHVDHGPT